MTSVFPRRVAQKVTLFLRARPTRRALTVLCLVWVALILAPLLAMSFYAYPTHDDFPSVRLASEAWATTGSLWATLKAAWDQAMYDYQTWQGTYVAMFVCAFQPMAFSMRLFWLAPFGALTLLALSAWYLVRQITRCVLKGDLCVCAALYAALMTLLLEYVPGIRELIYWQSAIQYALSVVMVMLLCGLAHPASHGIGPARRLCLAHGRRAAVRRGAGRSALSAGAGRCDGPGAGRRLVRVAPFPRAHRCRDRLCRRGAVAAGGGGRARQRRASGAGRRKHAPRSGHCSQRGGMPRLHGRMVRTAADRPDADTGAASMATVEK